MDNLTPIVNLMMRAAEKASYSIVRDFGELEKLQVSRKGYKNFVTNSDRRSSEQIRYTLSKAYPDISFICEESGIEMKADKDKFFIIDPIDGTTNFMRGIPYFAITISYMESGNMKAAVTYDPIRGEMFKGKIGDGAFISGKNRLRVSGREEISESVIAVRIPHSDERYLFDNGVFIRHTGALSLDISYFCAGKYDAVVAKSAHLWDIASAMVFVRESGGFLKCVKNEDGTYNILAASSNKLMKNLSDFYKFD